MHCPACGIKLCFCESCKHIDNALTENKDLELFICKGCGFTRPFAGWELLQLDINTEIDWALKEEDELPEELAGYCESPWSD